MIDHTKPYDTKENRARIMASFYKISSYIREFTAHIALEKFDIYEVPVIELGFKVKNLSQPIANEGIADLRAFLGLTFASPGADSHTAIIYSNKIYPATEIEQQLKHFEDLAQKIADNKAEVKARLIAIREGKKYEPSVNIEAGSAYQAASPEVKID